MHTNKKIKKTFKNNENIKKQEIRTSSVYHFRNEDFLKSNFSMVIIVGFTFFTKNSENILVSLNPVIFANFR